MKTLYKIIGNRLEGDRYRLFLKLYEPVSENTNAESIMGNVAGFIDKMKLDAVRSNSPESITVDRETWQKHKWNIGDTVSVEVLSNEKEE